MPDWKKLALPLGIGVGAATLLGLLVAASRRGGGKGLVPSGKLPGAISGGILPTFQLPFRPESPADFVPPMNIPSSLGSGTLVIGGRQVPVSVPVNHSLQFRVGDEGTTARRNRINIGVVHWSGGEPRDGSGVYNTLRGRGLSVHFIIDRSGTIWQCADPATVTCAHVGTAFNDVSWGVEVVDYGHRDPGEAIPRAGRDRARYQAMIQGELMDVADFLPAQYTALYALVDACTREFGLPEVVRGPPWERTAGITSFRGIVGHMHTSPYKEDPGTRPLLRLGARRGWRMS